MEDSDNAPTPTGILSWVGLGCGVFGLACLCIAFASPYWLQAYPNSFNNFQNIGLWEVCFHNYMHYKDDSQQVYNGCWWVFDETPMYEKLREWLLQPWFISVQVMVTACLLANLGAVFAMALVFLHCCPVLNHEYHQTYSVFAASALMWLVVLFTMISAGVYGGMCQDWQWMPRPDLSFLSWGFGFLIINGLFAAVAGVCWYKEADRAYKDLMRREDEWAKEVANASQYSQQMAYPYGQPSIEGYLPGYNGNGYVDQYSGYGYQPGYNEGYSQDSSGLPGKEGYPSDGSSGIPAKYSDSSSGYPAKA